MDQETRTESSERDQYIYAKMYMIDMAFQTIEERTDYH